MIEFKVGDTLSICAAVHEYCGITTQLYSLGSIGISKSPNICTITVDPCLSNPPCCISLSGLTVSFDFTNYITTVVKPLGTMYTDANGVASMNYTITQEDADLFNNNPGFTVRAYLQGSGPNYPSPSSSARYAATSNLLIRGAYIGNACVTKQSLAVCLNDKTLIVYENPVYVDGEITEVCVYRQGGSIILPEGKIKVFRLTNNTWIMVDESGYLQLQNTGVTTFSGLHLVVQKGDYIGLYVKPSSYDACIDSSGGIGLLYAKTHPGDVIGASNDSEWTILDNYRVAISATIVPCQNVTCPNICVGYDLYSQSCDPVQGCIQGTLIESNSPTCGYVAPTEEKHFIYLQVSTLFPASYIIDKLGYVYQAATNAILDYYSNYFIEAVDFDTSSYIITITITKRSTPLPVRFVGPDGSIIEEKIYTMIAPIILVLAVIAIAIIWTTIVLFAARYFGSKSVAGAPPSTRLIKVTPTTSPTSIVKPTFPIVVEYNDDKTPKSIDITDGNPISFSVPTNVDIIVTVKAKDDPYYKITKRTVPKCSPDSQDPCAKTCVPECEIIAVFSPTADATLSPTAKDSQGNPISCGYFEIYEQDSSGLPDALIKRQALGSDGKVDPTKVVADVNQCIYIVPCDLNTYRPKMKCYKAGAGQTETGDITVEKCSETKNQISVRTVYIAADGTRQPFTADRIDIKVGGNVVSTQVPSSDITLLPGLDKNTTYNVYVASSTYTMTTNDSPLSFGNTDCDIKDIIMEASTPPNAKDLTVEVRSSATASIISGASVILDSRSPQTTGDAGTVLFASIATGTHHFKITYTGYKVLEFDYNVTTSETISRSLDIDQVYANIDTRIANFAPSAVIYANSTIKFKGNLQYLDGTTWKDLIEATVNISVKKLPTNEEIKTFSVTTSSGFLSPGSFETTDWLVPKELTNTDISVHVEFGGVSSYKPTTSNATYHIGAECSVRNPITGECLVTPGFGIGFMALAGLGLLAAVMFLRPGGAVEIIKERPSKEIKAPSPE